MTRARTAQVQTPVVDSTATGAQNNWALGFLGGDGLVTWHGASDLQVTGLAAGVAGQVVTFKNTGTTIATFAHNSGSSSAGNKLFNFATSAPTPVAAGGFITYQHDGTQWQILAHEQGAWITPAYSAGDFTANGSMTWTVDAGDVLTYRYRLTGRVCELQVRLAPTSVGGTLNTELRGAIPAGLLPQTTSLSPTVFVENNGVIGLGPGLAYVAGGGTFVRFYADLTTVLNWSASTNNTQVGALVLFEVV